MFSLYESYRSYETSLSSYEREYSSEHSFEGDGIA